MLTSSANIGFLPSFFALLVTELETEASAPGSGSDSSSLIGVSKP
jgi:hypothetical protein